MYVDIVPPKIGNQFCIRTPETVDIVAQRALIPIK